MMSKSEMELLIAGIGEMFREYLATLDDESEAWREGYFTPRTNAESVFRGLLTWLETDGRDV